MAVVRYWKAIVAALAVVVLALTVIGVMTVLHGLSGAGSLPAP